ncbi:MAG TPA: GNAT family N-acetyltransferase [Devosia sp.]|jgi:ribosomal protein S18 acetylase RimI-like enzyme|nr:GNAT family N-acetyltransferase [Devosia sp.]
MIEITPARYDDLGPWLLLAEQVTPLFGPMPGLSATLERKIAQKQAYCAHVSTSNATLVGGVLIGGMGLEHWIRWLAVSAEYRRIGVGRMLMETAICLIPANSAIFVETFVRGSAGADAAIRLYESCGFEPAEITQVDGVVRQRYIRLRSSK